MLRCSAEFLLFQVLSQFSEVGSSIRLVITTTAFGLGVNIPDIRRVIHWGLPSNIEEYVQEARQVGWDSKDCSAILYEGKGIIQYVVK